MKSKYSPEFEKFWLLFKQFEKYDLATMGPKDKAAKEHKKLKFNSEEQETLLENARLQAREKYQARKKGLFRENFKQPFRYLRDKRFNDEIPIAASNKELAIANEAVESAVEQEVEIRLKKFQDRTWAD